MQPTVAQQHVSLRHGGINVAHVEDGNHAVGRRAHLGLQGARHGPRAEAREQEIARARERLECLGMTEVSYETYTTSAATLTVLLASVGSLTPLPTTIQISQTSAGSCWSWLKGSQHLRVHSPRCLTRVKQATL